MKELHIQPSELSYLSPWLKRYYLYYIDEIKKKEKEQMEKNGPPQSRSYSWVGKEKREAIKQRTKFVLKGIKDKLNNKDKK